MKTRMLVCGFVLGVCSALVTSQALSQDKGAGAGAAAGAKMPPPEDMQKMMESFMKSMKPGEHHKALEGSIGTWDTVTKIWMDPGMPPTETAGTAERKWVLGGRFMMETMKSEMIMPDPKTGEMKKMPWDGMGLMGYDNNRNLYVECWADNMGTQLLTMKGAASPDGKIFNMYGEMDEPMLNVYGRLVKYQTKITDENTQVFTIYDLHAGDNYKVVEVTYKRKK